MRGSLSLQDFNPLTHTKVNLTKIKYLKHFFSSKVENIGWGQMSPD